MRKAADRRRHLREPTNARIQIEWTDPQGEQHTLVGKCNDTSSGGVSGVFPAAADRGQIVSVSFPDLELVGQGEVRHTTRIRGQFPIGIELESALQSASDPDYDQRELASSATKGL